MARDILLSLGVRSDRDSLYRALTSSEGLAAFWTPDSTAEPRVGAEARFGFAAAPVPLRMRVTELAPSSRVAWTCLGDFPDWAGTTASWDLTPGSDAGTTTVLFKHLGFPESQPEAEFGSVAYTWATVLGALKAYAESGVAAPALA